MVRLLIAKALLAMTSSLLTQMRARRTKHVAIDIIAVRLAMAISCVYSESLKCRELVIARSAATTQLGLVLARDEAISGSFLPNNL
jgi:hypothetical protein